MPRAKKDTNGFAGTTHIGLVWDESGSMGHLQQVGVEYIDDQLGAARDHKGKVTFTLVKFGTHLPNGREVTWNAEDPKKLDARMAQYRPTGGTPLYDGVGQAVRALEAHVHKSDRALVVIFTDGHENSSVEWNEDTIGKLIADKEAEGNWSFAFTAAGLDDWDAKQQAARMGIAGQSVQSTPASPQGMHVNSGTTVASTSSYLESDKQNTGRSGFYGTDKQKEAKQRKVKS